MYAHAQRTYNSDLAGRYKISSKYALVVESSESATYITPFYEGKPVRKAIKRYAVAYVRLDVGGRLLTNYLK